MKKIIFLLLVFMFVLGCAPKEIPTPSIKTIPELCPTLNFTGKIDLLPLEMLPYHKSIGVSEDAISFTSGGKGGQDSTTFTFYLGEHKIVQTLHSTVAPPAINEIKKGDDAYDAQFGIVIGALKESLNEMRISDTEKEVINRILMCLEENK